MHSLKLLGNNLSARALLRYGELRHSPGDAGGLEQCANPARNPLFLSLPPSLPRSLSLSPSLSSLLPPPSSLLSHSLLSPLSSLLSPLSARLFLSSMPLFFFLPCFFLFLVSFFLSSCSICPNKDLEPTTEWCFKVKLEGAQQQQLSCLSPVSAAHI